MEYKEELDFLLVYDKLNDRRILCKNELHNIKNKYDNIPESYLDFLSIIGAGTLREIQFRIYDDLIDLEDLGLSNIYHLPVNIKFFGDNLNGDFAGFDLSAPNDNVIEFWHDSNELYNTNKSFHQYIREQILMDENGNDMRIN